MLDKVTGKGLVFPIKLTNGNILPEAGYDLIKSCIYNILMYEFGSRYFQRDFGVGIERYIGEPNDLVTETQLSYSLRNQLVRWDRRIVIDNLHIERPQYEKLVIILNISITGTDQTETLVFPINNAII